MKDSAIVPGPALVMITSQACIHSSMFCTNPCTRTCMPSGHLRCCSLLASLALRPHTTTNCTAAPHALAMAAHVFSTGPIPSPPATTSTAVVAVFNSSLLRRLGREAGFLENAGRMGRPCTTICRSSSPMLVALSAVSFVATKHLSTSLLNHVLWHVHKSVTTVAKLMGSCRPCLIRCFSTRNGTPCMRGCTETTRSGRYLA
mmetsp:Transcript_4418/g.12745  ORF Transcript_4418/g.12745 Transcript_4418/m.12745 type:complete len:202 (-) Transcript_4418:748-1353(-)